MLVINDEMIERGAIALYHQDPERLNWQYVDFYELSPSVQEAWRSGARAVLEAAFVAEETLEDGGDDSR